MSGVCIDCIDVGWGDGGATTFCPVSSLNALSLGYEDYASLISRMLGLDLCHVHLK